MAFPEVQSIVTNMGRPELATEIMGLYDGDVYVNFRPGRRPKGDEIEAFVERMDDALKEIPGVGYNFSAPMAMRLEETISGVRTELGVKVFGESLPVLEQKAAEIATSSRRFVAPPTSRLASARGRCRSKWSWTGRRSPATA